MLGVVLLEDNLFMSIFNVSLLLTFHARSILKTKIQDIKFLRNLKKGFFHVGLNKRLDSWI